MIEVWLKCKYNLFCFYAVFLFISLVGRLPNILTVRVLDTSTSLKRAGRPGWRAVTEAQAAHRLLRSSSTLDHSVRFPRASWARRQGDASSTRPPGKYAGAGDTHQNKRSNPLLKYLMQFGVIARYWVSNGLTHHKVRVCFMVHLFAFAGKVIYLRSSYSTASYSPWDRWTLQPLVWASTTRAFEWRSGKRSAFEGRFRPIWSVVSGQSVKRAAWTRFNGRRSGVPRERPRRGLAVFARKVTVFSGIYQIYSGIPVSSRNTYYLHSQLVVMYHFFVVFLKSSSFTFAYKC